MCKLGANILKINMPAWSRVSFFMLWGISFVFLSQIAMEQETEISYDKLNEYFIEKRYDDALEYCNKIIDSCHDSSQNYFYRGETYKYQGKFKEAIADFTKTIELNPNFHKPYLRRAVLNSYDFKNYNSRQKAKDDLKTAVLLSPEDPEVYYISGLVFSHIGTREEAIESLNKAIQLNPKYADAYLQRGQLFAGREKEKSIDDFSKAIQINPKLAIAYSERGIELLKSGQTALGCSDLKKACELGECGSWHFFEKNYGTCTGNKRKENDCE